MVLRSKHPVGSIQSQLERLEKFLESRKPSDELAMAEIFNSLKPNKKTLEKIVQESHLPKLLQAILLSSPPGEVKLITFRFLHSIGPSNWSSEVVIFHWDRRRQFWVSPSVKLPKYLQSLDKNW